MKNNVTILKGLKMFKLQHASLSQRSESEAKSLLQFIRVPGSQFKVYPIEQYVYKHQRSKSKNMMSQF